MPNTWRTVRVFISSTFRDINAERDHLVKVVFPALRERLEKHRVNLIDIDLRWGVTKAQAENEGVLGLCLQQIDECRPFFVGILGERYGWVPARFNAEALAHGSGWLEREAGKSVTELEILYGVLKNPEMRGHAFFYFRDPAALQEAPQAIKNAVYTETDPQQVQKLEKLKDRIRQSGYPVMDGYKAVWDPQAYDRSNQLQGRLVGLESFGQQVLDQLWNAFTKELQLDAEDASSLETNWLEEEADYQERFIESRLRFYVGREELHRQLLEHLKGDSRKPLLVTGPQGSGRSAVLANLIRACTGEYDLSLPHFVGASPRSTNIRDTLRRLCSVLNQTFSFGETIPNETVDLAATLRDLIRRIPTAESVLIVIDGVNQLEAVDRSQDLSWLPIALPSNVTLIISCSDEPEGDQPALDAARRLGLPEIRINPLTNDEQLEIIKQVPSVSAKTLDSFQCQLLLENPATVNPLFLLVALEELRGFGSYEQLNDRIRRFPREGDTLTSIFLQVIERLEEDFNREVVRPVLIALAVARRGLSERELQEVVHGEESGDIFLVLRQLRPYLANRRGLIGFYYQNLARAVAQYYLENPDKLRGAHSHLAEYFDKQSYYLTETDGTRQVNIRKVAELPWQLLHAANWDRMKELLRDIFFLEAKAEAGLEFDLLNDFATFKALAPASIESPVLALLEAALRSDIHFIARHPTTIFQCLWNRYCWFAPESAAPPESTGDNNTNLAAPVSPEQQLATLLNQWRAAKEQDSQFIWLRSVVPSADVELGGQSAVFNGHENIVTSIDISSDGKLLVSGSDDATVRVWDAQNGEALMVIRAHAKTVVAVCFSPQGDQIASAGGLYGMDRSLRVWDTRTGEQLHFLDVHRKPVSKLAFSSNGRYLVSRSGDGVYRGWNRGDILSCWDLVTGEHKDWSADWFGAWDVLPGTDLILVSRPKEGEGEALDHNSSIWMFDPLVGSETDLLIRDVGFGISHMKTSRDGLFLAITSRTENKFQYRVYELSTLGIVSQGEVEGSWPHELSFENGIVAVPAGGEGARIHIFDINKWGKGEALSTPDGFSQSKLNDNKTIFTVSLSPDGTSVYSTAVSNIRQWKVGGSQQERSLPHEYSIAHDIIFSPDGSTFAITGHDEVTVFSSHAARPLVSIKEVKEVRNENSQMWPVNCEFSADGSRIFLAGLGGIRVFDPAAGKELKRITGPANHEVSTRIVISPHGGMLASGVDVWTTIYVWYVKGRIVLYELYGRETGVDCEHNVAFSPDGTLLAYGSDSERTPDGKLSHFESERHRVKIVDMRTGKEILHLKGHQHKVTSLWFTSDSRRLVTGALDRTVRVWELEGGTEQLCLSDHYRRVNRVWLAPDDRTIFSIDYKKHTRIWDAQTGALIRVVDGVLEDKPKVAQRNGLRLDAFVRGTETFLMDRDSGNEVAWLPLTFWRLNASPAGDIRAGSIEGRLYVFTLAGRESTIHPGQTLERRD